MTDRAGLNKGDAAAGLTPRARLVHQVILSAFVHDGQAPARADLAGIVGAAGVDLAAALGELTAADLIVTGHRGALAATYPFSATPTGHRLTLAGGTRVYAMCATDALGTSAMLGQPVTITSAEPGTGKRIRVRVNGEQAAWDPPTARVYAAASEDCCAPSAKRTCGYINFFTTEAAARAWAAARPVLTGTLLGQARALAADIAEFGALLHDPPGDRE